MTLQSWRSQEEKQKYLEDGVVGSKVLPGWGPDSAIHHNRPRLLPKHRQVPNSHP